MLLCEISIGFPGLNVRIRAIPNALIACAVRLHIVTSIFISYSF